MLQVFSGLIITVVFRANLCFRCCDFLTVYPALECPDEILCTIPNLAKKDIVERMTKMRENGQLSKLIFQANKK